MSKSKAIGCPEIDHTDGEFYTNKHEAEQRGGTPVMYLYVRNISIDSAAVLDNWYIMQSCIYVAYMFHEDFKF